MPVAALIPIALQIFQAIKQGQQANKLDTGEKPNMEIPQGMLDAVDVQKNLALQTGLPGQDMITQQLDQSGANAMQDVKQSATSPWQITNAAQKIAGTKSDKMLDLGVAGANYGAGRADSLTQALEGLSKLQENQFLYNDYAPYMERMKTIRGLREAGNQNLYSGAANFAGVASYDPEMFNDVFGFQKRAGAKEGLAGINASIPGLENMSKNMFAPPQETMPINY